MKVHVTIRAVRKPWLNTYQWWVHVVDDGYHAGFSDKSLDKAVKEVIRRVRYEVPKYTRITWEYAPCGGDGCTGCGACWSTHDAALEILGTDRAAHEARVAELIDRNKGFLTP